MAIGAHRVTTAWGEGASVASRGGGGGAPAQNGDATWLNSFYPNQLWTTPGGDFVATASATRTVSSSGGFFTWASNASFVSDAQDMLDQPATNFGWLLKGDENNSAMRFSTRESSSTLRPQLRVLYAPRATLTSFGTGCNSTLGTPLVLSTTGAPVLGGSWNAQLTGAPEGSASFLFFAIGLEPTPLPIGNGCSIYLNAASMQLFASIGISPYAPAIVTNGVADHTIHIPFQVLLGGLQVEYQALLLDPFPVVLRSSNVQRAVLGF